MQGAITAQTLYLKKKLFQKSLQYFGSWRSNIPEARAKGFFPQNCCPPHSSRHLLKYIIHIFYVLYITYIFYTLFYTIFSTSTSTSTSICHMFCCAFLFVSRNRAKPPQARPSKTKRRHDRAFHPCSWHGKYILCAPHCVIGLVLFRSLRRLRWKDCGLPRRRTWRGACVKPHPGRANDKLHCADLNHSKM